jgi:hypothetical protein
VAVLLPRVRVRRGRRHEPLVLLLLLLLLLLLRKLRPHVRLLGLREAHGPRPRLREELLLHAYLQGRAALGVYARRAKHVMRARVPACLRLCA